MQLDNDYNKNDGQAVKGSKIKLKYVFAFLIFAIVAVLGGFGILPAPFYFVAGGAFFAVLSIFRAFPISKKARRFLDGALVFGTVATAGALGMFAPGILPFTLPVAPFYFLAGGAFLALSSIIRSLPISTKARLSSFGALVCGTAAGLGALGTFAPGILPFTLPLSGVFLGAGAILFIFFIKSAYKSKGSSEDVIIQMEPSNEFESSANPVNSTDEILDVKSDQPDKDKSKANPRSDDGAALGVEGNQSDNYDSKVQMKPSNQFKPVTTLTDGSEEKNVKDKSKANPRGDDDSGSDSNDCVEIPGAHNFMCGTLGL